MVSSYLNVTEIQDTLERDRFEIKQAFAFISLSVCTCSSILFYFIYFIITNFSASLSLLLYSPIEKDGGGAEGDMRRKEIREIRQS